MSTITVIAMIVLVGVQGIEPWSVVYKTTALPLSYTPFNWNIALQTNLI